MRYTISMKHMLLVWSFICLLSVIIYVYFSQGNQKVAVTTLSPIAFSKIIISPTPIQSGPTPTNVSITNITKQLVVPYWTLSGKHIDTTEYTTIIYFGVPANTEGLNTQDPGYTHIDIFNKVVNSNTKRLLTIRMIDSNINIKVLDDKDLQQKVVTQSVALAKEKRFDGIVLDFEITALGFDSVVKSISDFETHFATQTHAGGLPFYATVYGDTYARYRPYDVASIAKQADRIFIMAYDFHKANGDPGPNFPLHQTQNDGYDLVTMISDFLKQVPAEKITVVFGMYGYDWQVDDKQRGVGQAVSLSDNKIQQKFLDTCSFKDCTIKRDQLSAETEITYTDIPDQKHIVWFEDMDSVAKKIDFLKSKRIGSVGYWAYSYF